MSRWKVLPAELDPRVRQLVVRLRRLKDHSGLGVRQLAAKTGYSPKSWERYLGGASLPPAEAVEALARIAGDDPTRLLALREVAAEAWGQRRTAPEPGEVPAQEPESPGRALRIAFVAGAVTLVLAVSSAVLVTVRLMDDGGSATTASASLAAPATPSVAAPPSFTCRVRRVGGLWYAGNSRTRQVTLAVGNVGPDVAEAQCLLRRAGVSPGGIDGIFGPLTEHAVKEIQRRSGLVVDGMVGPHTWKVLRG
jgi:transcriptional regulator with XRE-family HTH domain